MGVLREENSTRLRASLRGVLPAVATLVLFFIGQAVLSIVFAPNGETPSLGATILVRVALIGLYVGMIGIAVWGSTSLDRRYYTGIGLDIDGEWVRNFVAGTVFGATGIAVSIWWGVFRGYREFDVSVEVSAPEEPIFFAFAVSVFVLYFLLGNVYEEVVYRGVMLQNFAEGLRARGFSPLWAVAVATLSSLLLFGLYHLPLRGTFLVVIDASMVGVTFALAYLLTGELGLPLGVHFGRISIELVTGFEILGVDVPAVLTFTKNTLLANLEVKLLELGVICLFILTWVYLTDGELGISDSIFEQPNGDVDSG